LPWSQLGNEAVPLEVSTVALFGSSLAVSASLGTSLWIRLPCFTVQKNSKAFAAHENEMGRRRAYLSMNEAKLQDYRI
jgi:hypothetical protein